MFTITSLAMSAPTRDAITIAIVGAVVGGLVATVLFELVRDRLMKVIRAAPKAIYKAMNANVSKPIVLMPVVVISLVIAMLILHAFGVHVVV
jgi:hypothetical protein